MTKKIVFFNALSDEAKEKARGWYREMNELPWLEEMLKEFVNDKLKEYGYKVESLEIFYSLSYCQGDGLSFSCTLEKCGVTYVVSQCSNNYYHANTMDAYRLDEDGNEEEEKGLLEEMRSIAKEAEKAGYDEIKYQNSNEAIDEAMEANEYTFTLEGVRMDPDNA